MLPLEEKGTKVAVVEGKEILRCSLGDCGCGFIEEEAASELMASL